MADVAAPPRGLQTLLAVRRAQAPRCLSPNALDGERPLSALQGVPAAFLAQPGELRATIGHTRWANPCTAACTVG
jgi:hypothetical protein